MGRVNAADILEMVAMMRTHGITSLRTPDGIHIDLGPAPRAASAADETPPLTEDERERCLAEGEARALARIFGSAS